MISVDDASPIPPFEQIRGQLADQITSGELAAGTRLPSVRQLAGDLRIAAGTVARAYQELEAAGLVTTSRASGTKVRAGQGVPDAIARAAARFANQAAGAGLSQDQAVAALRARWPGR